MRLTESFALAIKNITASKMRTFLTMLGIVIGITAVIVIVGLGNGMEKYMTDSFADMGTDTLTVSIQGRGTSRSVSVDEMYQMVEDNQEYLKQMSPTVNMSTTVKIGSDTADSTSVTGISEDYFEMYGNEIAQGRGLRYGDIKARKNVCIVGSYISQTYYSGNPVGSTIKLGADKFTIVGVMAQKEDEMDEGGTDDCIYLPYSVAARLSFTGTVNSFTITMRDTDKISESKAVVEDFLYAAFEDSDVYNVGSMAEMLDMMTSMINMLIMVLAAIAAISLVVGGIGIMNIMLVSVTERTREIGIRKALGAKERSILQQFVIEAALTSAMGGLLGILLGYGLSSLASVIIVRVAEVELTVLPSTASVLIAFGISAAIGIAFGYLPARRAASLNPIDALRYD